MKIFLVVGIAIVFQSAMAQDIIKENLGPNINTSYGDTKPLISPDGNTLFFVRQFYPYNTNGGKDMQDIYYSLILIMNGQRP